MMETPWTIQVIAEGNTFEEAKFNFETQVIKIREEDYQCTYASNADPNTHKLFSRRSVTAPRQEPLSDDEIRRLRDLLK